MALGTPTELAAFSSGTDGTAYSTSSISPSANSLLLMFVSCGHASAATQPSSITGTLGLTWTLIDSQDTTTSTIRGSLYWAATSGSPPTGTITANFGSTHSSCQIIVDQITGADLTTPIVQHGTPFQTTTTDNPGITLASAITAGNLTMGFNAWNRTFVLPVGTGYTQVSGTTSQASPTIISSAEYKMTGATLVDWTTTDDIAKILFAVEVGTASSGLSGTASLSETGTVTAAGTVGKAVGSSIAATDTITSAGAVGKATGASIAATGTISAAGSVGVAGTSSGATVTGTATTAATGVVGKATGASVSETATVTSTGVVGKATGASVTGTATVTATGVVGVSSGAAISATATIASAGAVVASALTAGASITATATITAAGVVAQAVFYFTPPTVARSVPGNFWGRYSTDVGQSVVRINGTLQTLSYPWMGELIGTEGIDWFLGGRTYPVSSAVAAELNAAGYTTTS